MNYWVVETPNGISADAFASIEAAKQFARVEYRIHARECMAGAVAEHDLPILCARYLSLKIHEGQ